MQLPMVGNWQVEVHAVRPFTIHGDMYYELQITRLDAPSTPIVLRLPQHAAATPPSPGDRLALTFLMGQVTAAKPI